MDKDLIAVLMKFQAERIVELCCLILDRIYVDLSVESLMLALNGPVPVQVVALKTITKNVNGFLEKVD
jgi:hypothetical protein